MLPTVPVPVVGAWDTADIGTVINVSASISERAGLREKDGMIVARGAAAAVAAAAAATGGAEAANSFGLL